jgi:hypothetical protein
MESGFSRWGHAAGRKLVIPNPRFRRVRDLLFLKKPRIKQIPHPVQTATGLGMTLVRAFSQPA